MDDHEYDNNDEDDDDDDDGFLAYDDDEYNSDGDSRSRSATDILNDGLEHQELYGHMYPNGRRSPNRKIGQR